MLVPVVLMLISGSGQSSSTTTGVGGSGSSQITGVGGTSTFGVGGSSVFLVQVHGTTVRVGVFWVVLFGLLVFGVLLWVVGVLENLLLVGLLTPLEHEHGRASIETANTATKRAKQITTRILMG